MDTLLRKLRQHMAELSLQGDDFTRQMWQMYAVFEDILERQNISSDACPSPPGCLPSPMLPLTLMRQFGEGRGGSEGPTPSMLAEALATPEGARLLESYERMLAEADYDVWSTIAAAPRDVGDGSDEEEDDDDDDYELDVIKRGLQNQRPPLGRQTVFEDSTTEFDSDELLETERRPRHHYSHQYSRSHFPPGSQFDQQRSLRRHRHRVRRRLPATPTARSAPHPSHPSSTHHQHRLVEELTRSSPSVHLEGEAGGASSGAVPGATEAPSPGDSWQSFRRSSAPELLDNPLLETISTIEDLCESDDYGDAACTSKATPLTSSNTSSGLSVDSGKAAKSEPSSSAEDKAQHSSDGDRDSVGYAGSNSVDSGYKSSCPTPELLDPCYYAQDALCNGSKRYSLASRAGREAKPRIPMGTRVIGRHSHQQARSAASASLPAGTPPSRPEYGYYDVNLDHLMYLRQSLLSAIKRCGGSVSPARISPEDSEYSGRASAAAASNGAGSRHGSPVRSRSSSRTSRGSPEHKASSSPSSSPQFSHLRSAPSSRVSTNLSARPKSGSPIRKSPIRDSRRSEAENSDPGGAVIPTLEEEIDTLLYGKAEYYDLESVHEFPCSYGTMIENKYRRSSLAKVKKLKESTFKNQDPEYGCPKVSSHFPHSQSSLSSASPCCPGSQASSISHQQEGLAPEKGKPMAANVDPAPSMEGVPTSTSQGPASAECKDNPEGSPTADPEVPPNKAKFSEVAKCMLKIIEDIQHQQQNGCAAPAPDCRTLGIGSSQDGAQRMAREDVTKGGHRASPAMYDSKRLSGADYHVYEEITYDLVAATGERVFRESCKPLGPASGRRFTRKDIPPPLPARPNQIFGSILSTSKPLPATFGSLGHQKVATHQKSQPRNPNALKRRGNLYSLFTEQSDRRHLSQSLEREWQKSNGKDSNDDEYGFKAVKKQPPL